MRIGYEGYASPITSIEITGTSITPKTGTTTATGIECYQADTTITGSVTLSDNVIQTPQRFTLAETGQITSDNVLSSDLMPGVNTKGVTWTDNSDGWTLAISESGSYKLTESFNLKSMTISKENVVIDGNGKTIIAVAGSGNRVITFSGENSELKNLKVTSSAEFTKAGKIIELSLELS